MKLTIAILVASALSACAALVTLSVVTAFGSSINLSWSAPVGVSLLGYEVRVGTTPGNYTTVTNSLATNLFTTTVSNLAPATTYYAALVGLLPLSLTTNLSAFSTGIDGTRMNRIMLRKQ